MKRKSKGGASISPTEATKNLFADVWKDHVDEVRTMAGELQSEKLVSITRKAKAVSLDRVKNPIPLSLFTGNE